MPSKDYAAIARAKISNAGSGRQPRYLIYGRNKKGKTRFCATAPNVLICDPEDGTIAETKLNPEVWHITTWTDLDEVYQFVKGGGKSPKTGKPYQWIALDGMSRMLGMAVDFVNAQIGEKDLTKKPTDQDQRRLYGRANKMIEAMLHNFHSLRHVGLIFTADERVVEIDNIEDLGEDEEASPSSYMYVPNLSPGARSPLNQVVDLIGRIYVVRGEFEDSKVVMREGKRVRVKTKSTIQRRLFVAPHEMYDTGCRTGYNLPDYLVNPTVASVGRALREGKVNE
jgi:AAA domain-containing protein